jgi:hypothetical protein
MAVPCHRVTCKKPREIKKKKTQGFSKPQVLLLATPIKPSQARSTPPSIIYSDFIKVGGSFGWFP